MDQAEALRKWLGHAFVLGLKHDRQIIPSDVALCMVIGPDWKEQRNQLMYQILMEQLPDCLVELGRQGAYKGE